MKGHNICCPYRKEEQTENGQFLLRGWHVTGHGFESMVFFAGLSHLAVAFFIPVVP